MQTIDKPGQIESDRAQQQQKEPAKGIIDRAKPVVRGVVHTCSQTYRGMTSFMRVMPDFSTPMPPDGFRRSYLT